MPLTNNSFDAERFAALWAGFDTGNANEAEAVGKARALRHMATAAGLRVIDVMGRTEVIEALDAQLQPLREDSPELKAAFVKITELADTVKILRQQLGAAGNGSRQEGPLSGGLVALVLFMAATLMTVAALH
jgi:hypothetical protein